MPKSVPRWVTNLPISTNDPGSHSSSTRSRAVSLPALCCRSMRSGPPPARASRSMAARRSVGLIFVATFGVVTFVSSLMAGRSLRQRETRAHIGVDGGAGFAGRLQERELAAARALVDVLVVAHGEDL